MTLRDQVGIRVRPEGMHGLAGKIRTLLEDESYGGRIREIREKTIANFGRSGEVGGEYILDQVKKAVQKRRDA